MDKTALNLQITEATALQQEDYTTASWTAFAAALADAQSVSAAEDATQETVNAATAALKTAMDALVARADNTNLVAAIDSAKELNGEDYLPDSWTAVANALAEAGRLPPTRMPAPRRSRLPVPIWKKQSWPWWPVRI